MSPFLALLASAYATDAAALGDDRFPVREAAEARLCRAGWLAYPALDRARRSPDPVVRLRAGRLAGRMERDAADLAELAEVSWVMQCPDPYQGSGTRQPCEAWCEDRSPEWHMEAVRCARRHGLAPDYDRRDPWDGGPPRPGWENPPTCANDFTPGNVLNYWVQVRGWNAARGR